MVSKPTRGVGREATVCRVAVKCRLFVPAAAQMVAGSVVMFCGVVGGLADESAFALRRDNLRLHS